MRPKVFIGSSLEGKSIAYAIQQHLSDVSEATVWDQGVFELSQTTIESLVNTLTSSDYGIFVFSPDDVSKIREQEYLTVRDNVIFELGLFIGKLGRTRAFIIIPNKLELHIPTDLLGITPGLYESNRTDNNLHAATGPVCDQLKKQIQKQGISKSRTEIPSDTSEKDEEDDKNFPYLWLHDFFSKKYDEAISKLNGLIEDEKDDEKVREYQTWKRYSELKSDDKFNINTAQDYIQKNDNVQAYWLMGRFLYWEHYTEKALEITNAGLEKYPDYLALILIKADCYQSLGQEDKAISVLQKPEVVGDPIASIKLTELFEEDGNLQKARETIHIAYKLKPKSEKICYKYARILIELNENEIALYLLQNLTRDYPENSTYWGYFSNCCVALDLIDTAMQACLKAEELTKGKEEWIMSNIGNIYNNQRLHSKAIDFLTKGVELNSKSEYAHSRLASSIKARDAEMEKLTTLTKKGRVQLAEYEIIENTEGSN